MDSARNDAVATRAIEWFLELQQSDVNEARISAWQSWLNADARHKLAFDQLQTVQDCIEAAPSLPWPTDEDVAADSSGPARRRVSMSMLAAAALAAIAIGVTGFLSLRATHDLVVKTDVGELRRVQLADGSTVTIGGHSNISVEMSESKREILLSQGEAYFEVAKDPVRPFTVHAGDTAIIAVGTAFDVRRAGQRTTVAVSEGAVEIKRAHESRIALSAGQQVRLDTQRVSPAQTLAPEAVATWRDGRRQYLAEPLADVIADLGRYSTRRIVIDDAEIGRLAITGAVFERDVDRWLRSLETALPVEVRTDPDGTVHLLARLQ